MKPEDLVLCRSDSGDGGWSLHAPWATDQQIATGAEPYLLSGEADWNDVEGDWSRPNDLDYARAMIVLSAQNVGD